MSDFPCWLTSRDCNGAIALISQAGFDYCGREDEFIGFDEEIGTGYKLASVLGWRLGSAYGKAISNN